MAYAWDAEMKLTRHPGTQMAERRENHPMTLHLQTKCLKNTVLILKTFYCVDTLLGKPYTLLSICKKKCTNLHFPQFDSVSWAAHAGPQARLCFTPETDFLTPSIWIPSRLLGPPRGLLCRSPEWADGGWMWRGGPGTLLEGGCSHDRYPPTLPQLFIKPWVQHRAKNKTEAIFIPNNKGGSLLYSHSLMHTHTPRSRKKKYPCTPHKN